MKHWYEDWGYELNTVGSKVFKFSLPNTNPPILFSLKERDVGVKRFREICDTIMIAFDQIQRDHGGYKK